MITSSNNILLTIRGHLKDELAQVDKIIRQSLYSDVDLVCQIADHIIEAGGKRVRPIVTLLAALACGYNNQQHYQISAVVEFIHTATLLHDDVVDGSTQRRGKHTANQVFGNPASVLVGDFLYSRAFQLMVSIGSMQVMQVLADTTNKIAEGEVLQLLNCHNSDISEEDYLHVIEYKTAKLFEAASHLGALITEASAPVIKGLREYGKHLGTAFQLMDDALDYMGSPEEIGKNIGDDLAEGKPTLPLIRALQTGNAEQKKIIKQAIESGDPIYFEQVLNVVSETNALPYTRMLAQRQSELAQQAIAVLPSSNYHNYLIDIAFFSSNRSF